MKKNWFLNTALVVTVFVCTCICALVKVCIPRAVLPGADVPTMLAVCLVALLVDHYAARGAKRCYVCVVLFGGLSFGLLSFCAALVDGRQAILLGIQGALVFTAAVWLFDAIMDRLSSGAKAAAAPVLSALCLFLAAQAMSGMSLL